MEKKGCAAFHSRRESITGDKVRLLFPKIHPLEFEPEPTRVQVECRSHRTSDEAHFWLNGYVNKQNCRIWSEANTQVYVETPLHPEKLTVWCALWAGGILLQKR
ncbi:hypothetical protein TNCV_546461 [Trichonephila clavipes]|nr:hypothetical protein TNCV_546461 [Trichonephila clavipes]